MDVVFLPAWPDNPYQQLLAEHLERCDVRVRTLARRTWFLSALLSRGRFPDVLHLHSPDQLVVYSPNAAIAAVKLVALAGQLVALRMAGVRIIWTAHDLHNHEGRYLRLDFLSHALVSRLAARVIVHCEEARRIVEARHRLPHSASRVVVIAHSHYADRYPNTITRVEARESLGLPQSARVFLCFGNLRPHRGIPKLVDVFRTLPGDDLRLVIAGHPMFEGAATEIASAVKHDTRIVFLPEYVPDDRVQVMMNACDVVVLPFADVLTSGSLLLAMSFARACVAPRRGCLVETLHPSGAFLYDPDDPDGLRGALTRAADAGPLLVEMGRLNLEAALRSDWSEAARLTAEVYRGS